MYCNRLVFGHDYARRQAEAASAQTFMQNQEEGSSCSVDREGCDLGENNTIF